jgi:fatty-acyl-CoA synthase
MSHVSNSFDRQHLPATIVEALQRCAQFDEHGYTFLDGALKPTRYSFKALWAASEARARLLMARGYQRGDRVAMVLASPEDFVITFYGCLIAGLVPVPMFPPLSFGKLDSWADSAVNIMQVAGASLLITDKQLSSVLWQVMPKVKTLRDLLTIDKIAEVAPSTDALPELTPEDLAFLQFTSGSTSAPKGVVVTQASLMANCHAIANSGMQLTRGRDVGVSWLPLYHDMGLIGFVITPLLAAIDIIFLPTMSFVKRPNLWMQVMHDYKATLSFGPNFAFALAGKRASEKELSTWDLSRVRVLGCGAEPINALVMTEFVETFARCGMTKDAIMPAYGMAEATLAMSFHEPATPLRVIAADADAFRATGTLEAPKDDHVALSFVSCGKAFREHALGVIDADGNLLPEGQEGELVFRGPSVTAGYYKNPEATAACFRDGWLRTGDLGFLLDGDVFITGRCKDLIILNGRNHHPQTIEWIVAEIDGVRRGNVVAFSRPGRESEELIVVCETKPDAPANLAETIQRAVSEQLSLKVTEVVTLKAGQLPKTSSGKLQRRKTREIFLSGDLSAQGDRTLGSSGETLTVARHVARGLFGRASHLASRVFGGGSDGAADSGDNSG